jgi:hypothetical protein
MADEIRIIDGIVVRKGSFLYQKQQQVHLDSMAGSGGLSPGLIEVTESAAAVDFGDVSPGWVILQNMDAAEDVVWGVDDGAGALVPVGLLKAAGPPQRIYVDPDATLMMETSDPGGTAGNSARVLVLGFDS